MGGTISNRCFYNFWALLNTNRAVVQLLRNSQAPRSGMPGSCCVVTSNLVQCFLKSEAQQLKVSPGIFSCRSHSPSCLSSYSVITALLFILFDMSQTYATVLTQDSRVILHGTSPLFQSSLCCSVHALDSRKNRRAALISKRCAWAEVLAFTVRVYMAHCLPNLPPALRTPSACFRSKPTKAEH